MSPRVFAFLVCSSLLIQYGTGQSQRDSLLGVWNDDTRSDTVRVAAFYEFAWKGYAYSNPDTALILTNELLAFTRERGFKKGEAQALRMAGTLALYRGNNREALDLYQRSLTIARDNELRPDEASSLGNIGIVYMNLGDYSRALNYYSQNLAIVEELGEERRMLSVLGNLGVLYDRLDEFDQALEYFNRSLKISIEQNNDVLIARTLNNIGNVYAKQGMHDESLDYYNRSLDLCREVGNRRGEAGALGNIGIVYKYMEDYDTAIEYQLACLELLEELGDLQGVATSTLNLGSAYLEKKDYRNAIGYCQNSLANAQTVESLHTERNACECLYRGYRESGENERALVYLERMKIADDTLLSHEAEEKLQAMEFKRLATQDSIEREVERERMESAHREELSKEEKTRNLLMGSGILALLLATGFYGRWRTTKKSKELVEQEKHRSDNLLLNILPHDIAEELKTHGKAEAREFKDVSILFTDFKGFTQASEQMDAQALVEEINICFRAFDEICGEYGVEKIKTIGDSYMAAGGLPVSSDDDTANTVMAALAMIDFIDKRKLELIRKGGIPFEMRVGIHTGEVVAGIVGVKKFQYDIWGDTVNTASRMESSSRVGLLNISESTYQYIRDDNRFAFEDRGFIEAKGKGSVRMFFVRRAGEGA